MKKVTRKFLDIYAGGNFGSCRATYVVENGILRFAGMEDTENLAGNGHCADFDGVKVSDLPVKMKEVEEENTHYADGACGCHLCGFSITKSQFIKSAEFIQDGAKYYTIDN